MTEDRRAFNRYVSEARRDPFELVLDDDESIVIAWPPIDRLLAATEPCTFEELLHLLAGGQYSALLDVLGAEEITVLRAVINDIADHFGLSSVARVADLIDRYGGAIRADLRRYYGVDMLDFFRDGLSAQEILDYLEHLPRTSAYHTAIADDEELAQQLAEHPEQKPGQPRLAEFSPEVQVLAEVRDLLASLINVQVARAGKKPSKVRPYPRPETALDRLRRRTRYERHQSLVERLRPRHE